MVVSYLDLFTMGIKKSKLLMRRKKNKNRIIYCNEKRLLH